MDAQKGQPVMPLSREDIIESLETCVLCGSKLRFSHHMDYLKLQVHEEAKCSECGIKSQSAQFILQ